MTRSVRPRWQLQDAKNRFSELVNAAEAQGPQIVTRRGADTAVVLSVKDYRSSQSPSGRTLVDILLAAPKVKGGLEVERTKERGRTVKLG